MIMELINEVLGDEHLQNVTKSYLFFYVYKLLPSGCYLHGMKQI